MGEALKEYPADFHPQPMFTDIVKKYGFRGLYYMDIYPFAEPMVFIIDPGVAAQVEKIPRHPFASQFLRGLVGTKSIFSTSGAEWHAQRSWFSPAFSLTNITSLVPGMVEEALIFREILTQRAVSRETFPMNEAVIRLTIDVIARTGFDIRLGSQMQDNEIYKSFQGATKWTAGQTEPLLKKLLSPYMMDWHTRKLDKLLGAVIRERYAIKTEGKASKSILDFSLKGYSKENGKPGKGGEVDLNEDFMKVALDK
jgi:cytochrome P450